MAPDGTVVLDCRWLGISGAGRTTELVLRGLAEAPPGGRWVLWGRAAAIRPLAWPEAEVRDVADDPRRWLGQRHAWAMPKGDFYLFMHQQRPLRHVPAATFVYDTIPLRYNAGRARRMLKRAFLRRIGRISRQVVTISEHSRACIRRDLGIPDDRVETVRFPFDGAFVDRVLARRTTARRGRAALFVGAFLPHKNVPALLSAFAATRFRRDGGRLILVGATSEQARELTEGLGEGQREFVTIRHGCSQADLEQLYATALFLVQPSLEEGFGLPAWEALCCGLPVCVSDGGALPEVTAGFAEPFPARSVPAMTAAIDACAEQALERDEGAARAQSALLRARGPSIAEFGAQVRAIVARHAALVP